jgi:hypothetical protein
MNKSLAFISTLVGCTNDVFKQGLSFLCFLKVCQSPNPMFDKQNWSNASIYFFRYVCSISTWVCSVQFLKMIDTKEAGGPLGQTGGIHELSSIYLSQVDCTSTLLGWFCGTSINILPICRKRTHQARLILWIDFMRASIISHSKLKKRFALKFSDLDILLQGSPSA